MKITCPDCDTSYEVTAEALGPAGRSVKCTRCGTRWHADPAPAAALSAADEPDWPADLSPQAATDLDAPISALETAAPAAVPGPADAPQDDFSRLEDNPATDTRSALESFDADPAERAPGEEPAPTPVDIETLARKPKINVKPKERRSAVATLFAALGQRVRRIKARRVLGAGLFTGSLALCALFIAFRTPIVARMPDLAGLFALAGFEVNLRGLEFRDLRTFREMEKGAIVLVVEGTIENITREPSRVPALRFSLRSEDAQEIYAWVVEPRLRRLDPGATTRFRTRLSSPPELAADIQVRFVERDQKKQAKS